MKCEEEGVVTILLEVTERVRDVQQEGRRQDFYKVKIVN